MLVCGLITAAAATFLVTGQDLWQNWSRSLLVYISGLFYSLSIGLVLTTCSPFIWHRTAKIHPALGWTFRSLFILAGTAAGCLLAGFPIWGMVGHSYGYWASFRGSFGIAIFLSAFTTAALVTYDRFKSQLETSQLQLKEKEVEREKALKLATAATLSSLESRLHPHFLFNTINSISALIQEDPARAEKMLSQMADLLRFSLDSGRTGLVPLAREMKIVCDYLEIEKARFEDRLRYQIDIPAEFDDVPFPPLSLQTLVENSVKYAVNSRGSGADIRIHARRQQDQLTVSVEDNGPGFQAEDLPAGHGLNSLIARLESVYGGAARLAIASEAGLTVVSLRVPSAVAI